MCFTFHDKSKWYHVLERCESIGMQTLNEVRSREMRKIPILEIDAFSYSRMNSHLQSSLVSLAGKGLMTVMNFNATCVEFFPFQISSVHLSVPTLAVPSISFGTEVANDWLTD